MEEGKLKVVCVKNVCLAVFKCPCNTCFELIKQHIFTKIAIQVDVKHTCMHSVVPHTVATPYSTLATNLCKK